MRVLQIAALWWIAGVAVVRAQNPTDIRWYGMGDTVIPFRFTCADANGLTLINNAASANLVLSNPIRTPRHLLALPSRRLMAFGLQGRDDAVPPLPEVLNSFDGGYSWRCASSTANVSLRAGGALFSRVDDTAQGQLSVACMAGGRDLVVNASGFPLEYGPATSDVRCTAEGNIWRAAAPLPFAATGLTVVTVPMVDGGSGGGTGARWTVVLGGYRSDGSDDLLVARYPAPNANDPFSQLIPAGWARLPLRRAGSDVVVTAALGQRGGVVAAWAKHARCLLVGGGSVQFSSSKKRWRRRRRRMEMGSFGVNSSSSSRDWSLPEDCEEEEQEVEDGAGGWVSGSSRDKDKTKCSPLPTPGGGDGDGDGNRGDGPIRPGDPEAIEIAEEEGLPSVVITSRAAYSSVDPWTGVGRDAVALTDVMHVCGLQEALTAHMSSVEDGAWQAVWTLNATVTAVPFPVPLPQPRVFNLRRPYAYALASLSSPNDDADIILLLEGTEVHTDLLLTDGDGTPQRLDWTRRGHQRYPSASGLDVTYQQSSFAPLVGVRNDYDVSYDYVIGASDEEAGIILHGSLLPCRQKACGAGNYSRYCTASPFDAVCTTCTRCTVGANYDVASCGGWRNRVCAVCPVTTCPDGTVMRLPCGHPDNPSPASPLCLPATRPPLMSPTHVAAVGALACAEVAVAVAVVVVSWVVRRRRLRQLSEAQAAAVMGSGGGKGGLVELSYAVARARLSHAATVRLTARAACAALVATVLLGLVTCVLSPAGGMDHKEEVQLVAVAVAFALVGPAMIGGILAYAHFQARPPLRLWRQLWAGARVIAVLGLLRPTLLLSAYERLLAQAEEAAKGGSGNSAKQLRLLRAGRARSHRLLRSISAFVACASDVPLLIALLGLASLTQGPLTSSSDGSSQQVTMLVGVGAQVLTSAAAVCQLLCLVDSLVHACGGAAAGGAGAAAGRGGGLGQGPVGLAPMDSDEYHDDDENVNSGADALSGIKKDASSSGEGFRHHKLQQRMHVEEEGEGSLPRQGGPSGTDAMVYRGQEEGDRGGMSLRPDRLLLSSAAATAAGVTGVDSPLTVVRQQQQQQQQQHSSPFFISVPRAAAAARHPSSSHLVAGTGSASPVLMVQVMPPALAAAAAAGRGIGFATTNGPPALPLSPTVAHASLPLPSPSSWALATDRPAQLAQPAPQSDGSDGDREAALATWMRHLRARAATPEARRLASCVAFFRFSPQLLPAALEAVGRVPLPPAWMGVLNQVESLHLLHSSSSSISRCSSSNQPGVGSSSGDRQVQDGEGGEHHHHLVSSSSSPTNSNVMMMMSEGADM